MLHRDGEGWVCSGYSLQKEFDPFDALVIDAGVGGELARPAPLDEELT